MRGRSALVTGAARGIGAATVDALCARGYRVAALDVASGSEHGMVGVDYALAGADDLARVTRRWPDQVLGVVADVRDAPELTRLVAEVVHELGGLDAVVAGAAVVAGGRSSWEEDPAVWRTLWEVDVMGVVHTAQATVPHLLDSDAGRFVSVASAAAHRGLYALGAYCAAKHAVVGFTKGLAADLVGTGVTACTVSPGSTDTDMLAATAAIYELDDPSELTASMLVRRMLRPDEVGEVISSCCEPSALTLNGSVVHADGGF